MKPTTEFKLVKGSCIDTSLSIDIATWISISIPKMLISKSFLTTRSFLIPQEAVIYKYVPLITYNHMLDNLLR